TRTPDLNFIVSAAESVGSNIKPGMLIVLQSTTHPGTTEEVVLPILEQRSGGTAGKDFFLGYAPERVDPGNATFTIKNTPKLVAGVTEECLRRTALLYEQIVDTVQPVSSSRLLLLGMAYKADVHDTRESPSLEIMRQLIQRGGDVRYCDPWVSEVELDGATHRSVEWSEDEVGAADCVVVLTPHTVFS